MLKNHLEILKRELKSDEALLLDVREKEEWDEGHLKDAQFVPLSELKEGMVPELDTGKKLYLHCRSGKRVFPAAELLKAMDCATVIPLKEGFTELVQKGFEEV